MVKQGEWAHLYISLKLSKHSMFGNELKIGTVLVGKSVSLLCVGKIQSFAPL